MIPFCFCVATGGDDGWRVYDGVTSLYVACMFNVPVPTLFDEMPGENVFIKEKKNGVGVEEDKKRVFCTCFLF